MSWQPGQGLGRTPGAHTVPVLPQLKWDKGGPGASTHVKRLGLQTSTFRRAGAPAGGSTDVAATTAVACCSSTRKPAATAAAAMGSGSAGSWSK